MRATRKGIFDVFAAAAEETGKDERIETQEAKGSVARPERGRAAEAGKKRGVPGREGALGFLHLLRFSCPSSKYALNSKAGSNSESDRFGTRKRKRTPFENVTTSLSSTAIFDPSDPDQSALSSPESKDQNQDRRSCMTWLLLPNLLPLEIKLEICMKRMETSQFYRRFVEQIENSETFNCFRRVLGSESEMQVVVYGIGSIDSYETPRLQLSLLLLMKRKFSWMGGIEVFDPILSATESQVLHALGCSVLSVNEQGRRCALKPTLFYMPHCEAELYDNLLHANQEAATLKNVVLLGNSFETYEEYASAIRNSSIVHSAGHILALKKLTCPILSIPFGALYSPVFPDSQLANVNDPSSVPGDVALSMKSRALLAQELANLLKTLFLEKGNGVRFIIIGDALKLLSSTVGPTWALGGRNRFL
ncbi:hypothetical protein NL676_036767 [Syzygium grande]|nr:hypothetical protein NL676_036767 [Syzygium grande]